MMYFWGKVVGGLAGLATARPSLALLGLFVGHWFDRRFAEGYSSVLGQDAAPLQLSDEYARSLFEVMGHLAKADGLVTPDEIRAARSLMHRLNLGPAQIQSAIGWFNHGKQSGYPLLKSVHDLRARNAKRPELRSLFVRLLMEVSLSKSRLQHAERSMLWTICKELDISRVELAQLEAMLRAQRGFRQSPQGDADAAKVRGAYTTLGVDQAATNADIKKAYRRLMSKHHPDKLSGSNPDATMVDEAERQTREVRAAYELLKTRRAIR